MDRVRILDRLPRGKSAGMVIAVALAVGLLAVTLLVSSCGKVSKPVAKTAPVVAVVTSAQGTFRVRRAATDYWLAGSVGTSLLQGDVAQTGASVNLVLVFTGGARVQMNQNTYLRVVSESGGTPKMEVDRGYVYVDDVSDRFGLDLQTPAATATVEGTKLDLKVEPGGTSTLTVMKGKVRFASKAGRVVVGGSRWSVAVPGQAPSQPVQVDIGKASPTVPGYSFFVEMQIDPYYSDEAARDKAESDARGRISIGVPDTWAHVNLGRARLDSGDRVESRLEFDRVLELDPQFSQALAGLGKVSLLEGKWDEASQLYERAYRADRSSLEAVFGLGQAALGRGDLREAERWYKEALEMESGDARARAALAVVKFLDGDLEAAADGFKKALSIDPSLTGAYDNLAVVYSLRRRMDRARSYLEKALQMEAHDYTAWNSLGNHYANTGDYGEAERCFMQLNRADEPMLRAMGYQNLGVVEMTKGNSREALGDWQKSLDLEPNGPAVLANQGNAYLALGEDDAAVAAFSRAVQLEPENWNAHAGLARAYIALGMVDQAIAEARRGVELNPSDWLSHLALGLALKRAGKTEEARQEFRLAREHAPAGDLSAAEHAFLGDAYEAEKSYRDALKEYREASGLAPGAGSYHRFAGDVLYSMKREKEALKEYRTAVRLDPADSTARMSIALILHAEGDRKDALDELEKAVEEAPDNMEARLLMAEYLVEDGDLEGALSNLQAVKTIPGAGPAALSRVMVTTGNAYDMKQDFASAVPAYREAIAYDAARGDAWFYLAGDLERTGDMAGAREAYKKAVELCAGREEWKKFQAEAALKLKGMPP